MGNMHKDIIHWWEALIKGRKGGFRQTLNYDHYANAFVGEIQLTTFYMYTRQSNFVGARSSKISITYNLMYINQR